MALKKTKRKTPLKPVGLRPETHAKLSRIAAANRWKLNETVDALTDKFLLGKYVPANPGIVGTVQPDAS